MPGWGAGPPERKHDLAPATGGDEQLTLHGGALEGPAISSVGGTDRRMLPEGGKARGDEGGAETERLVRRMPVATQPASVSTVISGVAATPGWTPVGGARARPA